MSHEPRDGLHCRVVDTTLSYVRGADVPLLEQTISQAVSHAAARFADGDALVVCHQNVRLTWRELDREVTRTARGLAGLGLRPGDRAGIWASNRSEEHTSELQSLRHLVCRLLLEKKKQ